ncbi:MAG: hypothetical protein AAF708_13395 [Deinococcota bacterium]
MTSSRARLADVIITLFQRLTKFNDVTRALTSPSSLRNYQTLVMFFHTRLVDDGINTLGHQMTLQDVARASSPRLISTNITTTDITTSVWNTAS